MDLSQKKESISLPRTPATIMGCFPRRRIFKKFADEEGSIGSRRICESGWICKVRTGAVVGAALCPGEERVDSIALGQGMTADDPGDRCRDGRDAGGAGGQRGAGAAVLCERA